MNCMASSAQVKFQFTHPGGVRLRFTAVVSAHSKGFNSRTREGCDAQAEKKTCEIAGFNSRTREGCD